METRILYNHQELQQIVNLLNILVVLNSALVAKQLFDMVYRMILRYAK